MKFIYKLFVRSGKLKIKTKLLLSYIVLITLPINILSIRYYAASKDVVLELARNNVLEIVKKNNELIDEKLSNIYENSLGMDVDCGLYGILNNVNTQDTYNFLAMDKEVTHLINKYYSRSKDIYSVQLVTSYYTFGDKTKNIVSPQKFERSQLFASTLRQGGRLTWIPTYDFTEMFDLRELKTSNLEYRYLLSAARILNVSCVNNGTINSNPSIEPALLVVNFKDDLYRRVFENSVAIEESSYIVAARDGTMISNPNRSKLASVDDSPWLKELTAKGSGAEVVEADGRKLIACYDTSKVTGWLSVVLIPPEALTNDLLTTIKSYVFYLAVLLTLLSVLFAYLFSARITKPIVKIIQAIKKVGVGDFNVRINDGISDEFGLLIHKFNDMNDKIKDLIEENYVVRIREKETEIMALNIQLNPHFLYNTLNIMNWMAIAGEKEKTSKMLVSLSRMLQYTTYNREETTVLREDLEWLKEYIHIMANRFEGKFSVHYFINPQLLDLKVPKLFLQPFIENSILHGFQKTDGGGMISIYGWMQEDTVGFSIEDNGCGFEENAMQQISHNGSDHVGIKNVDKRIKLLYGADYGVRIESEPGSGTRITIIIPLGSSSRIIAG